jgi:Family of unknown function (DUF6263)
MKLWRWVGALMLVGAVGVGVSANDNQGSEKPTWKAFDELNKPFWQEMKTDTSQTMKVQGMEVVQKQSQTFFVKWTPKSKDKDCWKVEYEIVGVKMDIQIGGNNIAYDSTANKDQTPQNPLTDFFKALVGSKFTFTVCSDAKEGIRVTDVDGLEQFVNKLAAANEQLKPLLQQILTKDALKQMSNPTFAAFPRTDEEFKKGTWDYDTTLNMGPIGSYKTKYVYTLAKDGKKIDVTGNMDYAAPKSDQAGGLPFQIKKGELKAEKVTGTVTLDPKAGRIADSTMQMDLAGNLTIDIAGMETNVALTQKQTSSVKTLDSDPVPAPSAKK